MPSADGAEIEAGSAPTDNRSLTEDDRATVAEEPETVAAEVGKPEVANAVNIPEESSMEVTAENVARPEVVKPEVGVKTPVV